MTPEENDAFKDIINRTDLNPTRKLRYKSIKTFSFLRTQYEYESEDGHHYILAYHETGPDGISTITKWSKHSIDDVEEQIQEQEYISTFEDFHTMIDSQNWEKVGHKVVVIK